MDREQQTQTIDACPPDRGTIDHVLGGAHHNPHGVLGAHPHPNGTVVRTLRPHADEVAVLVDGDEQRAYPLVRVHDAGLWSRGRARGARRLPPAGALRRRRPHRGRPVPLAAHARRDRPAPDRRGPPRAAVGRPRRARPHLRHPVGAGHRHQLRGLGAHRPGRARHRRLRRLGGLDAPDALAGQLRGVGALRARRRGRHPLQVPHPRPRRAVAREGRPDGVRAPRSRRPPRRSSPRCTTSGTTPTGWRARAASDPARRADERLRGAPRLVAAGPGLPARWPTSSSSTWTRPASPTSSCCRWPSTRSAGRGATRSPRTTRRRPGSAPRTTSGTSSTACTRPATA